MHWGAIAVGLILSVAGTARAQTEAEWVESGARLYMGYCASCHGVAGRGGGPVASSLVKPPADLTRLGERYGLPLPKDDLARFIDGRSLVASHGTREMPVWGEELYPGDTESEPREAARRGTILLILEYLDTIQRAPGS